MKISKYILFICIVHLLCTNNIFGVSAYPYPTKFLQPDGDTIIVTMKGDEFLKYAKTEEGYTLLYDKQGFLTYARQKSDGFLEPSQYKVRQSTKRNTKEQKFLDSISPNLFFPTSQLSTMQLHNSALRSATFSTSQRVFPTKGKRKLLCILAEFSDKKFTKSNQSFDNLFNQIDYSAEGATGSVRDYFKECSYDQLDLQVDVVGPFQANNTMAYYGKNSGGGKDINVRELIREMIDKADPSVDYSIYDNDNDGWIDGLYIIYAGYGEEAGGGENTIWAHAWTTNTPITKDGKIIYKYSCSAELRANFSNNISSIGVICHEFGHTLGAPDYYDTNYATDGEYEGTGNWDLQGSGSWNNYGKTPAHPNARTKIYIYRWATANELTNPLSVTIPPSYQNNNAFYQIRESGNEYFLIENRQKKGFDSYIPGNGLIIYHGNLSSVILSPEESLNTINAKHPQLFYPVSANASVQIPNANPSSYGQINSSSSTWPGTNGKTSFTSTTTPALKRWDGTPIDKPITNIQENNSTGIITFDFKGGFIAIAPTVTTNTVSNLTQNSVTLNGNIVQGSDAVTARGFDWKSSSSSTWTKVTVSGTNNVLTYNLRGLITNTSYNVRAFATTVSGTTVGNVITFTTKTIVKKPTVITNQVTNVQETSAVLNGSIVNGSEEILSKGFDWKSSSSSTWTKVTVSDTNNVLTYNLRGLITNTSYNVRAFATTVSGTTFGNTISFTTLSITPPTVTTNTVSNLTQNSVTLNGNIVQGSDAVTARGFDWKSSSSSTWTKVTVSGTNNVLTYNLRGLITNTSYNVRAFATTVSGTTVGNVITFTTKTIVKKPTVITNQVTNVQETSAVLNGSIVNGSEEILSKGFEWKSSSSSTWTKVLLVTKILNHTLKGLKSNTTYYVRAFAITPSVKTYGTIRTFKYTPTRLSTTVAKNITDTTAVIGGTINKGSGIILEKGMEYKPVTTLKWNSVKITSTSNILSVKINTLIPNTTYQFRSYVKTDRGVIYGVYQQFTTTKQIVLGIEEKSKSNIVIYPNPVKNSLNLKIEELSLSTTLIITNALGQVLHQQNIDPSTNIYITIDMETFAQGNYCISIQNSEISHSQWFIKY